MDTPPVKMELKEIPVELIDISKEGNVRKKKITKGLDELKKSIQKIGLQQPPVVFKKGDRYELVIGQRRFIAVSQLGWKTVPALVRSFTDITEAKIASLSENIHRVRLSPRDMSEVCSYLLDEFGSVHEVAEVLGVSQPTVYKYLGYRIVPEPLKKMVDDKKITAADAMKISQHIEDVDKATRIAERTAELPRPAKERVFDVIREAPEESEDQIFEKAEKARIQKEIVLHLSEEHANALNKASKELGVEPEDVAKDVVVEWLEERSYV